MSNPEASNPQEISKSRAYQRMKRDNPEEFEPQTIFFATSPQEGQGIDWQNCLQLKAAMVYHAITGKHVNKETKTKANNLLGEIAKECKNLIGAAKGADSKTSGDEKQKIGVDSKTGGDEKQKIGADSKTGEDEKIGADSKTDGGEKQKIDSKTDGDEKHKIGADSKTDKNEKQKIGADSKTSRDGKQKIGAGPYSEDSIKDGVFLVVGFLSELRYFTDREKANNHYLNTHKQEIVKDIIKIENQLPLKLIHDIVENVEKAINSVEMKKQLNYGNYSLGFTTKELGDTISQFCWYYSPIFYSTSKKRESDVLQLENLLHCLHHSLKKFNQTDGNATGEVSRCPGARQLKRSGVQFEASSEATIDVRFTQPTLRMPALAYDFKLETVVRNLLAWECLPKEDQKPVTRYFQLINELAGDLSDVRVMKKSGLVRGWWKNLREVLDLLKRIDGSVSYPSVYMELDREIRKVSNYNEERMKSFFVRNRPAVVWFSSVAAASAIGTVLYASKRRRG